MKPVQTEGIHLAWKPHSSPSAALQSDRQMSRDSSLPPQEEAVMAGEAAAEAALIDDPSALYVPACSSLFNLIQPEINIINA